MYMTDDTKHVHADGNGEEFELQASDLLRLLDCTIPLASTDTALPGINVVMLRREGNYLTATATDRYVAGKARVLLNPNLPAPRRGWSFPLGLADAKALRKLCWEHRKDRAARARFVDQEDGVLSMPISGQSWREFGVKAELRPSGFPKVESLFRNVMSTVRSKPQVVGGLDITRVAQFAPAAKIFWSSHDGAPIFWDATPDRLTDDDGSVGPRWALKFGTGVDFGMIGLIMGVKCWMSQSTATNISDWNDQL
jgi:hypothetical protein